MSSKRRMALLDYQQKNSGTSLDIGVLDNGVIVVQFGDSVKEIQFTAAQAKAFGLGLIEMAVRSESGRAQ